MADPRLTTLEKQIRVVAESKVVDRIQAACAPLQTLIDEMTAEKGGPLDAIDLQWATDLRAKIEVSRALDVIRVGLAEQLFPSVYEAEVQDLLSRKP